MGGGASKAPDALSPMTPEEVANAVADLGQNYVPYKSCIMDNGVSGQILFELQDSDMDKTLEEIGVTTKLHRSGIINMLNKLKKEKASNVKKTQKVEKEKVSKPSKKSKFDLPKNFQVLETVDQSPRELLQQLFLVQGTPMNIYEPEKDLQKLEEIIASEGDCDGSSSYDCFISYRVSADQDVARSIHDHLQRKGVFSFWDSVCLKPGENWKDGFLQGLKKSRKLLWLVSSAALEKARDYRQDHTHDNFLLELVNAFKIKKELNINNYIIPIFIGRNEGKVYKGFSDFNLDLYSPHIGAATIECPYKHVYFHKQWWCGADNWLCCKSTTYRSKGCCSRALGSKEKEDLTKGIVYYHTGRKGDVGFAGLYITNQRWKCCGKESHSAAGCKRLTLSADEHRELLVEQKGGILLGKNRNIDLTYA